MAYIGLGWQDGSKEAADDVMKSSHLNDSDCISK